MSRGNTKRDLKSVSMPLLQRLRKLGDVVVSFELLKDYYDIMELIDTRNIPALWWEADTRFLKWFDKRGKVLRPHSWLNTYNSYRLRVLYEYVAKRALYVLGVTGARVVEYMGIGARAIKVINNYKGIDPSGKLNELIEMYKVREGIDHKIAKIMIIVAAKTVMLYYDKFFRYDLPKTLNLTHPNLRRGDEHDRLVELK